MNPRPEMKTNPRGLDETEGDGLLPGERENMYIALRGVEYRFGGQLTVVRTELDDVKTDVGEIRKMQAQQSEDLRSILLEGLRSNRSAGQRTAAYAGSGVVALLIAIKEIATALEPLWR